jgi:hypothetical protein
MTSALSFVLFFIWVTSTVTLLHTYGILLVATLVLGLLGFSFAGWNLRNLAEKNSAFRTGTCSERE